MTQKDAFCKPLSLIRDTEIEEYALKNVKALVSVAGLDTENAQVVLINDASLNAFVAGGGTVYIHTGLIEQAENSDEFLGVLAHETGHLVGGHTASLYEHIQKAQKTALVTTILGGIAAVASGRGDVGMAIMAGGMGTTQNMVNAYRQTEENSADSTAVSLLEKMGASTQGLIGIMKKIQKEERLRQETTLPYVRTHPMTRDRLDFLTHTAQNSRPLLKDKAFDNIKAKLIAFLKSPDETYALYSDNSEPAEYARAIAAFKTPDIQKALVLTEKLIEKEPDNPYFYELKGQILFETGQVEKAVYSYEKALALKPKALLIRLSLAHALLEVGTKDATEQALSHIEYITVRDRYLPDAWRFLSIAYGRLNRMNEARYALAEYDALIGDKKAALSKIEKSLKETPKSEPLYQRLLDLKDAIMH